MLRELLVIGALVFGGLFVAGLVAFVVNIVKWRERADTIETKIDDHLKWHSNPVKRPPRRSQTTNGDKR